MSTATKTKLMIAGAVLVLAVVIIAIVWGARENRRTAKNTALVADRLSKPLTLSFDPSTIQPAQHGEPEPRRLEDSKPGTGTESGKSGKQAK